MRALAWVLAVGLSAWAPAAGQTAPSPAKNRTSSKVWTPPRTSDGQPDLQGIWATATITPLERPAEFAGKEFLTEQEAADYERRTLERVNSDRRDGSTATDLNRNYNEFWRDRGTKVIAGRRTSLIVDPPDGRVPLLTPEAQKRRTGAVEAERSPSGPEDCPLRLRCVTRGRPMLPTPNNNYFQILQAPGFVVILQEMMYEARVIPLDRRPHAPQGVRGYMGDPRGRWDGNTLVIETTNFSQPFRGSNIETYIPPRLPGAGGSRCPGGRPKRGCSITSATRGTTLWWVSWRGPAPRRRRLRRQRQGRGRNEN